MICYPLLGKNGEFGNQLFQIAATVSHAIDCNDEAIFPQYNYNYLFKNKIHTTANEPIIENNYTEEHFYYSPIPKLPNLSINGYFQTEKYFINNKKQILDLFEFADSFTETVINKYSNYLKNNPVGVQLRTYSRGSIDPRNIHSDVFENEGYLQKAFNYFGKDRLYVLVTDNFAYAQARLPKRDNIILLNTSDLCEDFCLLTLCTDLICSASSFGWWASYLNKNNNKKIIMPKRWFNVADDWYDIRDIYPAGVIKF